MKKLTKILTGICMMLCICLSAFSGNVFAEESSGNIEVTQVDIKTKKPVAGIKLTLYRIADYTGAGLSGYEISSEFAEIGLEVDDLGEESVQEETIDKIESHIDANGLSGLQTLTTDESGVVDFTGLGDGIYMIRQINDEADFEALGYRFVNETYLVTLPRQNEDGSLTRSVSCKPKGRLIMNEEEEEYVDVKVYKVWEDNNDKYKKRPTSIRVGLYDGEELTEEIQLEAVNNWSYEWSELDAEGDWSVQEIEVPEGYTSKVTNEGTSYTITNTYNEPNTPPGKTPPGRGKTVKTGDNVYMFLYILAAIVCAVGVTLLLRKRRR